MTDKPCVLILGATSDIGRATARAFAARGFALMLAARDPARVEADARDLDVRHGTDVTIHAFDALEVTNHAAFVESLPQLPDIAVSVVGVLGDQAENAADPLCASAILRANFEGPALLLGVLANRFEARGSGILVGVSSVAGDRGRATNYVYGSAKAGLTAFLSGLRNRLAGKGVHVVTVKPGFVDTAMTAGMTLPPRLTAQPEEVGEAIAEACVMRRDVIYVRPIWRLVMAIIRAIPERIFKRLSL